MAISDYLKKGVQTGYKAPVKTSSAVSTPTVQAKPQAKWYSGAQPTARETGAQVYRVGMQDPSQQAELNRMFEDELDNPSGPIYQPYRKATSTSFTKTNVQNTQKAQAEWAGLQDELSYWAGRSDLNLSDDEIIGRIDWKKYSTLAKMDEQAAMGTPLALVDAVGYSKDAMYGALWAARNPGQSTGDAFLDSIQGQLGRGQQFKTNDVNGWRNATSGNYAPYKAGATALDDLAYKYRMDGSFDMDWLNTQGRALLNGDEQMKKDYNTIYSVVSQTEKLDAELQRYREEVNSAIASGLDPRTVFYEGMMQEEYPELYKALEGQRSGKLVGTSRALDFDFDADVLAMQDAYQQKTGTMDDADFAADVSALLGVPTMGNEAQKAVTVQTNAQLQEAGSIFAKWFTPSEAGAMYTADAGYAPTKQQLAYSILNGTAGDNEAYASAMDAANAYAAEFWLNSVNTLNQLKAEKEALEKYAAFDQKWAEKLGADPFNAQFDPEYIAESEAIQPYLSVAEKYGFDAAQIDAAIANEEKVQANILQRFADAEKYNTTGMAGKSVMPLLTFVDAFGGYESVRYPNTEWGKSMSEGSDWATVSKSIAEQEKSNGVMLRMINTALKQAEQYGLGEDYTRGLIAARDDIVRENQLMQYDKLHGAKDFDSQVSAFDKSQMAAEPKFFYVRGSANDAEVYRAGIVDMEKALAAYGDDDTRLLYPGQMTDYEKETYKYLFMTQGEEAATGYVEALIPMLDARYRQGVLEQADDATSTIAGTIGANALTVLGNLTGVFSLASNAISSLTGEEVDPYSPTFPLSAFSGRVRENTRKAIGEDNPWVVAYDAGMAAADSLTAALAGGGSQFITLALQSGNAANASLMEAKMRGASDQQAWMYAGAFAAAEYFTERGPVANLLDAFANGGTGVFKDTLIRGMLAEGFGEGISEIVNTVSDNVIMQELSQYNASVEQYMAEGYTEEAAKRMAATDVVTNVFYSGMIGAVSSAPTTAASYAAGALNKRTQNKFKSRAEAALSKAQSDGAGKPAQAAAMAAAMEAGGSNPEDADAAASAMAQTDPQATYTLWSVLEHSNEFDAVSAVELGALVPDSQTGNLFALIKEEGATDENVAQLIETAQQEMSDPAVKARYDAAIASYAEGMATMTAMVGADLSGIKNAQRNAENAGRTLQTARTSLENARASMKSASTVLQNAQKRFSNDHGDKATAAVIKAKERYQKAQQTLEGAKQAEENARKDYDAAKAELETMKQNTLAEIRQQGVTARDQIMANRQAVQEQKAAEAEAKRQEENVLEMEFQNYMAENAPNATPEQEAELRGYFMETMTDMQNEPAAAEEGTISPEEAQQKAVDEKNQRFTDAISKRFGLKVQFTDQLISGAKGAYNRSTGTLYLRSDLSQGEAIFEVALHELTHRAEGGGLAYNAFASNLLDIAYKGDKQKLKAEIRARRDRYNNRFAQIAMSEAAPGNANLKPLSSADAKKELVADLTRKILYGDENLINQLVESSPETAYTFMDWLKDTMKRLVGIKDPMVDRLEHTRSLFEAALNKAGQRPVQDVAHPNAMQFSIEQFARASGFATVRTDGDVPYAIVDDDGNEVTKVTPEMIQNSPVGRLVQSALRNGTIDEATANAQYGMLSDLMTMICEYKDQAMIWELAGSELFSAIKSNSDAQYGTTVDFGTICSKTREVVNVMSETMLREGRGLTRDEVIEAYRQTHNVGLAVPCPVCYVFSRWMGVPSLLETMRKGQERFSNATNEQVNEYLHSVESKYAPNGEKVSTAVSSAKGKVTAKLDKIANQLMKSSLSGKEVSDLENQARALEAELADIELYNWVKQVLCKTDSKRNPILDENGNVTIDPDYKPVPNEILLDLRRTGEFASEYGKSWTFRTTRGAGMGKAILPYSGAELGDSVAGTKRWAAGQNPFFTGNDKVADRKVKNARVRARAQNLIGGQRFQSTSDYRPEWGLDYLSTFLEMQAIGAKGQLYTKVIEAVDMYATAGIEVNLSIMAKGNGYHTENGKNVLGVEDFSSVTGIDFSEAYKKTQQYDNVQMILVGLNDDHIRAAMSDDRISFIIPWHASGNSKTTLANLMEAVGESAGEATDYSKTQTDKVENQTPAQKAAWDLRSAILTGKLKKGVSAEQQAILDSNPYLSGLYNKFYVDKDSEAYGVKLSAKQAGQIFPHEYWDTSSTVENADENGRRFVEYCESMGVTPRFSQFKDDAGYWKLLIDRRMYNRDGSYHHPKQIDVTNVKIESVAPEVSQAKVGTREQITEAAQRTIDEIRARVPEKPFDMTVEGVDLSDAQYSIAEDEDDGEPDQAMSSDPEVQKENMRAWMNRQGQRQFAGQTVQNSSAVPEEYKPTFMMPENLLYAKDTNREQVERAWQRIQQNGFEAEYNRLLEKEEVYDADDTAEANLMMAMALNPNTSDPAVFMSLALRYNEKGTENAQALQVRQLFKKMTPTGAQVWVAGKAEKDLKERRRTHQPEAKMVDDAAQVVADSIKDKQGGDELLRLTSGGDFTIDANNNKWGIPLNEQQKALIDQYDLNDVNRPGLFYNRATVKQRMLEAIIATPTPLEVTGLGLNLIQRLEYMKRGDAVVTNADLNYIGARMAEFIGAGEESGGRAAELALARAYEAYGNIKPATGWEKVRAQRYANMLLSAPSVIRNVIGNALQNTMNAAAHGTAVEVDKIISKFTGKRTLDHLTVKERADGWAAFVEETKNTFLDYYVDRANTAPNREKYSTSQRGRVFNNGIQEGMRNLENFLMSVGDRNVWKKAFVNSLAEQQRLADHGRLFNTDGTTMTHEQMVEQAEKDANYATFTEDNAVQELMGALAAKHPAIADVISVYLPFTGVPSNIVKRSLQFSPVGLAYTIGKWGVDKATHKSFDQRTFVNNLSRGLTGTGLMVVGALLAKFGMIKLGTEDEDGNKAYDAATAMGEQYTPYVYDPFTDTYVSMSTFAPALSPLVWGTAAMESLKGDEDAANALLNSLMYSTDSIFDASYLSGFSDIFNSQGSFTENLINTGLSNITSQTVPAFITQLANATDPYVRNTKDKDKLIEMLKVTANKIPGLRQALPEKVDVAGDTVRTKGWWSFIDPFTRTNPSYNEALIEANRLYDLTGDTSVLPSDLLRSRTNTLNVGGGKKLILENADKEWYQKRYGEIWTTALMELMRSPKYARMDDDERAEALKKILSDAMSQAKKEAWEKYGEE